LSAENGLVFGEMMSHMGLSNRARELAETLRLAIRRGQWAVGQAMPSTRQIAREQHVSLATVQSALSQLEEQGLIERHPRRGTVVKLRLPRDWAQGNGLRQIGIIAGRSQQSTAGNDWTYRIAHSLELEIARQKIHPVVLHGNYESTAKEELVKSIEAFGETMMGVIAFNGPLVNQLCPKLDEMGLPWVIINRSDAQTIHNFVAADNLTGCRLVGECFARMDLHRVLVLMARGINESETEKEKITGLIHGFLGVGAPINGIDYFLCGEGMTGRERVAEYLNKHEPPQAIFSLNDEMASGAIVACVEAGLSIPQQVKIVGGAGLDLSRHTRPTLSVITQPMAEMGVQACQMLMELIQKGHRRIERRRIKGKLLLRDSLPVPQEIRRALEARYPGMVE
jgi:DNA-binding LacI/PurR family transcriptional regulator